MKLLTFILFLTLPLGFARASDQSERVSKAFAANSVTSAETLAATRALIEREAQLEADIIKLTQECDALNAQLTKAQADLRDSEARIAAAQTAQAAAVKTAVDAERARIIGLIQPVATLPPPAPTIAAKLSGNEDTAVQFRDRWETFTSAPLGAVVWFLSMESWDTAAGQFGACSYHLPRAAKLERPVIFALGLGPAPLATGAAGVDAIIGGSKDAVFRRELAALAAFRPQDPHVPIRLGHEANGDWYAWSLDPAKYRAAWRHVADIARTVSDRLQLVWNVNAYSGDIVQWYPGSDVVGVISFDHYHRGGGAQASFAAVLEHDNAGFARIADFARANGKPLAIDEWGAVANSGPWVDLFAAWVKAQPLLWHGYWDSDSNVQTSISSRPTDPTAVAYMNNFRS